jgi:hypothetical protein
MAKANHEHGEASVYTRSVRTRLERLELADVFADGTGYVNGVHESLSPVQVRVRAFLRVRITNGSLIMNMASGKRIILAALLSRVFLQILLAL